MLSQACQDFGDAFFFRLDAGRFATCPAHLASAIFLACSIRFLGGVLFQRLSAIADAAGSPSSFRDMETLYMLAQALSKDSLILLDMLAQARYS
jgi:hypothetical protein